MILFHLNIKSLSLFFLINLCTSIFVFSQTHFSNKEISLKIESNKLNYLVGEPLWIDRMFEFNIKVKLEFKPLVVPNCDLKYEIINSKNDTLKYQSGIGCGIVTKNDGKPKWGLDDLIDYYGSLENFENSRLFNNSISLLKIIISRQN